MNNKTKYNKEKAEEIKKQLTELFLKSETKPVSFSRKKMAEELDCSPNHITYILKKNEQQNKI